MTEAAVVYESNIAAEEGVVGLHVAETKLALLGIYLQYLILPD